MHLPLVKCFWCENCQAVIDSAKRCEGCGSHMSIVALSIWMDRSGTARTLTTQETMRAITETGKRTLRRELRIVEADTDGITPYHYAQCDPEAVK